MPRRRKQPQIACEHFKWRLRLRNGVLYADGRGGTNNLGRHSLNTKDPDEALARLRQLDRQKAIELGLAQTEISELSVSLRITDGWQKYLEYCGRSQVLGGVAPTSLKRYQLIRDRHVSHCQDHGITTWNEFDRRAFEKYGDSLSRSFAYRTCYVDLTQIKAAVKWLVREGLLPADCVLIYPLRKPQGSDTYCYSQQEVAAMKDHCSKDSGLIWLANIIVVLAHTGLRISELESLRWSDVDLPNGTIRIADERSSHRRKQAGSARTTKGRRSRIIPIHPVLRKLLFKLERKADGLVVHGARGKALRANNALKIFKEKVIEPLRDRYPTLAGEIGFEHGTFHAFRHYFCSQCFLGGASEGEIREWLGHRDSNMVELYRHLRNEDAQRKMEQLRFVDELDCGGDSDTGVA